jgi:general stress protein YciG
MTSKHTSEHAFADDPEKIKGAGKKGGAQPDIKLDRAEKARVGGQHSHGGSRTGKD